MIGSKLLCNNGMKLHTWQHRRENNAEPWNGTQYALRVYFGAVRKGGTVSMVGVYGARYNMFPLGDFFARNITLKMGQCPVHSYTERILNLIQEGKIDATDIVTHQLSLDDGPHRYEIFDKKKDNCIKVILHP